MPAVTPPVCEFDWPAPSFEARGVDGEMHRLGSLVGPNGLIIAFICNHCPYVRAITDRLVRDFAELKAKGVASVAICSNDPIAYPQDDFEPMAAFAAERGFDFPYLHDADQSIARAYGAACTPDFFGFNTDLGLQYRGRLDSGRLDPPPADAPRELLVAMTEVAETGRGPAHQTPSIGCSIKWKT